MTEVLTREQILARRVGGGRETVELPGGGSVVVRGLSRKESHHLTALKDTEDQEIYAVSCALVDPALSEEDIRLWFEQEGSAGDIQAIAKRVNEMSGLSDGSGKELTKSVPQRRGHRR